MEALLAILLVFVICLALFWLVGRFFVQKGSVAHNVCGVVIAIVFLFYALQRLGLLGTIRI